MPLLYQLTWRIFYILNNDGDDDDDDDYEKVHASQCCSLKKYIQATKG